MILLWLGCAAEPPPAPDPPPPPTPVVTQTLAPPPPVPGSKATGAVALALTYSGVGPLHQRYFGEPEIAGPLAVDLGVCLDDQVRLRISYDEERRVGVIRVIVDAKHNRCVPEHTAEGVTVSALEPIGVALATYRDAVANRFDLRVANFRIELEAFAGTQVCRLGLEGQFPPDGTTWSPCVEIMGERVCNGKPKDGKHVLNFVEAKHTRALAGCFK